MFDKKKVFIGIAPIGWTNDDIPELGKEITFEQCLSEMALERYKGCEIGNKFPQDVDRLKKELRLRNLKVANRWFSSFLLTEPYEEVEKKFIENCKFLKSVRAKTIGVSEQSHSIQKLSVPVFDAKYEMNNEEWTILCEGLNKLSDVAAKYGITLTYHHHMGTVVQTVDEIDRLMKNTDENKVFLLYDSGHLAYCGEDYIAILERYVKRIKHVHLKDIRPDVIRKVKENRLSFLDGVKQGTFTVPGDGSIDFHSIFEILSKNDYSGWLLVEAEQDPAQANPLEYAKKARKYIRKIAKL
ncbi:MAG: myo-inosose-2 dehydratase [Bacillota bacterium]